MCVIWWIVDNTNIKKTIYKIYEDEVVVVEGLSQALTTEKPLGGVGVDYLICCFCIWNNFKAEEICCSTDTISPRTLARGAKSFHLCNWLWKIRIRSMLVIFVFVLLLFFVFLLYIFEVEEEVVVGSIFIIWKNIVD